jgi:hypothetical protein
VISNLRLQDGKILGLCVMEVRHPSNIAARGIEYVLKRVYDKIGSITCHEIESITFRSRRVSGPCTGNVAVLS